MRARGQTFAFAIIFFIFLFSASILMGQLHTKYDNLEYKLVEELRSYYDFSELPTYRAHSVSGQISTYDLTGGNNDGFNGTYSYLRRLTDSSLVLFDMNGPGVVNRFWTPTPTNDTLDFYVDDTLRPCLSICYMDLFSGKVYPFVLPLCGNQLGGYFAYFPILFQYRCLIICRGKKMQFHQIEYRLFPQGTRVKHFSPTLSESEAAALQMIDLLWTKPNKGILNFVPTGTTVQKIRASFQLAAGETRKIGTISGGGRIVGIHLAPTSAFEGLNKDIDLRIVWDDETVPAIDCPVADFFGYAFGKNAMKSLLLGSEGSLNYCYFPMPFDKKATIELVSRFKKEKDNLPISIDAEVYYTTEKRRPMLEGKLYSHWIQNRPLPGKPHVFLQTNGKGHYVSTILQAQGLRTGMTIFFEGDDSTVIDGEMRLHGTGSEDYFNGGWYALLDRWDTKMSLPLHGALDYSLLFARTGGYRLYLNDKLSFDKSIYHSIEHGPSHNTIPVIYTSVCLYYCNHEVVDRIDPASVKTNVFIPDTLNIYPQYAQIVLGANTSANYDHFDLEVNNSSKLKISLADVPPGAYQLFISFSGQSNGVNFSVWQRQTQISPWVDLEAGENKFLGDLHLTEQNNAITLHFTSLNNNGKFSLEKMMLVKIN